MEPNPTSGGSDMAITQQTLLMMLALHGPADHKAALTLGPEMLVQSNGGSATLLLAQQDATEKTDVQGKSKGHKQQKQGTCDGPVSKDGTCTGTVTKSQSPSSSPNPNYKAPVKGKA
jgi:hypothetical protein